ncbi:membrane protein insertion efficiency factor YidD [Mycoavidus sp. B2-EB]|uniref:membrane protein insertion efficiency factor YidD n=1 Tax=Mycoavidus sp. B2-EB TaxID=2651972 RepID=UPI0016260106|nr:membrane protein insertion efficiency factor YidD [Mycoavidus sp. B2-EB]BBO60532.1 putative membrane protein insertion efficiency factor [Mycoavidus sp. B2-EB]
MQKILLMLLRCYKLMLSPYLGNRCRFIPSCSDYAREAIQYYGAARGSYLAFKRVCRCHPFAAGGIDSPLPLNLSGADAAPQYQDETKSNGY